MSYAICNLDLDNRNLDLDNQDMQGAYLKGKTSQL
jgi:hypothetical protein